MQERLKALKKAHGSKELGKVTVDMAIGGMRGITVTHLHACSRTYAVPVRACTQVGRHCEWNSCTYIIGAAVGNEPAGPRGGHPLPRLQHP